MMTVKQVSSLTGVSVRTLQFYDEIGLFRPTQITDAGYRLYDPAALETLQQILFFKELDFTLKEIKAIMENPNFDKTAAFLKQRELIALKRDRLSGLLGLLDKLLKGEAHMDFKEFDMSEYFRVLDGFKKTHTDEIVARLGSLDRFDEMLADMKTRGDEIAAGAAAQYGSLENYTRAMERSFEDFLQRGPAVAPEEVPGLIERTEALTKALTADLTKDPAAPEVREAARALMEFTETCSRGVDMGENFWSVTAERYLSDPVYIQVNDRKYGPGASRFIGLAIRACLEA
ncbi:MerR family transcriptional regulator [Pseudoflavonifractor phocaeensis]|uniref:MerR family transcriptional regulator n=1 Tax=Pseudoflavonifractor phocaeensis TaxID=1870988 RepID=UPI00210E0DEB|nr:MerR family transcriptional regulator [Pseudoflavonifractor phocaeensis]MCQ4865773.1 MerR family transcriptional regulator [Pseudoflavonifractor phocaeensis]